MLCKDYRLTAHDAMRLVSTFSTRVRQTARDYLYEDRLVRRLAAPGKIVAELRGYHDRYTPHCAENSQGLQLGCSCLRRQPCAHVAALLTGFGHAPDSFLPPWPPVGAEPDAWWAWAAGMPFAWDAIDETPPAWRRPFDADSMAWWAAWTHTEAARPSAVTPPEVVLAGLHPSWTTRPEWRAAFSDWLARRLSAGVDPGFWIPLQADNPFLPLDPLWETVTLSAAHQSRILGLLFAPSDEPDPLRRISRVERLMGLLARLDPPPGPAVRYWLWQQFEWADPLGVERADALYAGGHRDEAVRLLEEHMPGDPASRAPIRRRLASWAEGPDQLAHLVADCVERGSLDCLETLRAHLTQSDWETLSAAIRRRAARPSAESDPVPG